MQPIFKVPSNLSRSICPLLLYLMNALLSIIFMKKVVVFLFLPGFSYLSLQAKGFSLGDKVKGMAHLVRSLCFATSKTDGIQVESIGLSW